MNKEIKKVGIKEFKEKHKDFLKRIMEKNNIEFKGNMLKKDIKILKRVLNEGLDIGTIKENKINVELVKYKGKFYFKQINKKRLFNIDFYKLENE